MDVAGFHNRRLYFIRPYVSMLYPLAGSFSCSVLLQPTVKGLNIFTARARYSPRAGDILFDQ